MVEPKWRSWRKIPLSTVVINYLNDLISNSPYHEANDFVFYGKSRSKPISFNCLLRSFKKALRNIGIDEEEQRQRGLHFHSLRHTFTSIMRNSGVPDVKVMRLTGHKSKRMLENYSHFEFQDFKDVAEIQENILHH